MGVKGQSRLVLVFQFRLVGLPFTSDMGVINASSIVSLETK